MKSKITYLVLFFFLISISTWGYTDKYDCYFKKYTKSAFGNEFDWKIIKSQAIVESSLRENVKSRAGAYGLMQLLPETFDEVKRKLPDIIKGSKEDPRWNIAAGIYYDLYQWKFWKGNRSHNNRLLFMFASYNTGVGNMMKAYKRAVNKGLDGSLWISIEYVLPEVTGQYSEETIKYVNRIFKVRNELD